RRLPVGKTCSSPMFIRCPAVDIRRFETFHLPSFKGKAKMVSPEEKQFIVAEPVLKEFASSALQKVGVPEESARSIIDNLVQANLRGVESHGIVRLPIY